MLCRKGRTMLFTLADLGWEGLDRGLESQGFLAEFAKQLGLVTLTQVAICHKFKTAIIQNLTSHTAIIVSLKFPGESTRTGHSPFWSGPNYPCTILWAYFSDLPVHLHRKRHRWVSRSCSRWSPEKGSHCISCISQSSRCWPQMWSRRDPSQTFSLSCIWSRGISRTAIPRTAVFNNFLILCPTAQSLRCWELLSCPW